MINTKEKDESETNLTCYASWAIILFVITALESIVIHIISAQAYRSLPVFIEIYSIPIFIAEISLILLARWKSYEHATLVSILALFLVALTTSSILYWLVFVLINLFIAYNLTLLRDNLAIRIRDLMYISILSLPLAVISLNSPDIQLDISNWKAVLSGNVHQDTLFHASIASMLADFGKASTGLHGLVPIHYHFLSHWLYGHLARCLDQPIYKFYCIINSAFGVPILFSSCIGCAEVILPSRSKREVYLKITFLIILLLGFFGYNNGTLFDKYKLSSDYSSESFNLALFFLVIFITLLNRINKSYDYYICFILCVVITVAKVSVGAIAWSFYIFYLLALARICVSKRIGLILVSALVGYLLIKQLSSTGSNAIGGKNLFWFFIWSGTSVGNYGTVPFFISFIKFTLIHLFYGFLLLGLIPLTLVGKIIPGRICFEALYQVVITIIISIVAIVYLTGVRTSVGYFTDITRWVSIPYLIVIIPRAIVILTNNLLIKDYRFFNLFSTRNNICIIAACVMLFGAIGMLFSLKYVISSVVRLRTRSEEVALTPISNSAGCIRQLIDISRHKWTKKYAVYVPPTEYSFWTCNNRMTVAAFIVPALSERVALFALPTEEHLGWNGVSNIHTLFYGFDSYNINLPKQCSTVYSEKELLKVTKDLGFYGYISVTSNNWRAHNIQ